MDKTFYSVTVTRTIANGPRRRDRITSEITTQQPHAASLSHRQVADRIRIWIDCQLPGWRLRSYYKLDGSAASQE